MSEPIRLGIISDRYNRSGLSSVLTALEYAFLIVYFGFLWYNAGSESAPSSRYIADLVFTQFFGQLVTVIVAIQIGGQHQQLARWLLILVYGGLGLWIMLELTDGWLVAVVWAVSLLVGLVRDRDNVLGNALAEGIWLMVAAFIAALAGSIAGVPEESLLTDHIGTTAGWGILYYVGLLLVEGYTAASPTRE